MKKEEDAFQKGFLIVVNLLTQVPLMLWGGWVASKLWQWFAQEPFGLPHISMVQAVGLQMVVSVFTVHFVRNQTLWDEFDKYTWTEKYAKSPVISLFGPGLLILVGWGWRQFL